MERLYKSKLARIVFGVTAVVLVLSAIFRVLTPQPIPAENVVSTTQVETPEITIIDRIELPESLPQYGLLDYQTNHQTLIAKLLTDLSLEPNEAVPEVWENENGNILLTYDENTNLLKLTFIRSTDPIGQENKNDQPLLDAAQAFVAQYITTETLIGNIESYYAQSPNDISLVPKDQADGAVITFYQKLGQYNFYFNDKLVPLAKVLIAYSGQISQVEFTPETFAFDQGPNINLLTIEEIEAKILNGGGIYLSIEQSLILDPTPQSLKEISIKPIAIEYRAEEETGATLPYLRYQGSGVDVNDTAITVELIVPLVPTAN